MAAWFAGAPFCGDGAGFKTFWIDMVRPEAIADVRDLAGQTLGIDLLAWVENEMACYAEHAKPHLRFVFMSVCYFLKRNVRLIAVHRKSETKKLEDCVSVLDALGVSRLTVDGEGKEGRAHVLASLAALQREGVCDAVLTSTAEVFLYGATRCFECPSFFQLRSSGLLERTSRSHAVFGAASSEALAHRRILAFAALVGCTKSNGEKTLRLTAHDALQFINTSGPGDDALADVQVWAAQQALPLQCDVDAYLAAGDARVVSLTRRPNLEMILGLHWKLMIVGSSDNRSHSSGELRSAVQKLLARLEVDAPGLSLPLQVTKEHSARVEAATHVAPVEFAHCSKASANEGDLAELPRDSDIVRVLWRATAGVGQPRRLFSTVEASAAFKSVYPMLRPGDAPNRLKVRGFFGI